MEKNNEKDIVCVTGGTSYISSWLIMKLLQSGYSVNTTINNFNPDEGCFLENLPNASKKLRIFNTNLEMPESFRAAIEGCNGVFITDSVDFEDKREDDMKIQQAITGILNILQACLDSKTIKKVIYTSSDGAVAYTDKGSDVVDESSWSDTDFIKKLNPVGAFYSISKTLIERAVVDFAEKYELDIVCLNHAWVLGPFITPQCPEVVRVSMAMILGNWTDIEYDCGVIAMVHVDDVARTYIFLYESAKVKGRYICSSAELSPNELSQFLRTRYPQYQIPTINSLKVTTAFKFPHISSKKLLDTGFKYKYNLEEMYDEAIVCCKHVGLL